ncbi:hypothetical protein PI124_g16044 [Phytophthora idaei]|nr:hypothetical protein PI125_g14692 [Phytophthora idaei]KAG3142245.1 hypothetical protein PI126_g15128 [Phytophthora idaei]KAG3239008.1 hypothetical protein PI124_g16044 [Phytophthora idaei]
MNVIFSDRFAECLTRSDNAITRDQLDAGELNTKTLFWKEVDAGLRDNTTDYNKRFDEAARNPRFAIVNPSIIVPHDASILYDMWKQGDRKFKKANT